MSYIAIALTKLHVQNCSVTRVTEQNDLLCYNRCETKNIEKVVEIC